jgi:hypothetical protein
MKKQLMTTSALVAAGVLAGTAFAGTAAADVELNVGGNFHAVASYASQDDGVGEPGEFERNHSIGTAGELQLTAKSVLENGLEVAARIEYEATNQGATNAGANNRGKDVIDETWISFSGDFGSLKLGNDDNAAYTMHYQAPVGAWQIGINTPSFAVVDGGGNAVSSYATTYPGLGSDGAKILYFSPRISGFQLGVSYQPDGKQRQTGSFGNSQTDLGGDANSPDNDAGEMSEIMAIGVNFQNSFSGFDVSASAGYVTSSLELATVTTTDDTEQMSFGLTVGFAGFAVGGSYLNSDGGALNDEYDAWELGVTYGTGPWTVGINYENATQETGAGTEDELDAFLVSGTYNLGPGVDVYGGIKYYDYTSDTNAPANENEALVIAIGSGISF